MDDRDSAYYSNYSTTDDVYESIPDYGEAYSKEPHQGHTDHYDEDSDFDSEEWDEEDYENYENGAPDANYENEEDWTNPQPCHHGRLSSWDNFVVAPPDDDDQLDDGYLEPGSSRFMEPPGSPPRTRPPIRKPPPLPQPEETQPPGLPPRDTGARGRAPLPMPPKDEIPQSPPSKVLPPAPPVSIAKTAIGGNRSPQEQPKSRPAPPKKPAGNKIMQFANMFEQKQAEQAPTPKKQGNKTGPSFLHTVGASRFASNRPAQPPVPNGFAGSSEEEDVDDYEKVGEAGAVGQDQFTPRAAAGKPQLPSKLQSKPEPPAKPTTERNKGLVNPFPGMDPMNSTAVRKNKENLKQTLENLFSNKNGTEGRKVSAPNIPSSHLPQNNDRKRSEPLVPTLQVPQARFNKQMSLDSELSGSVTSPRVGVGRPDRPLPPPPVGTLGRNPTDRPLPPVPMQPPSPPIQSQQRLPPPLPNPGGIRSPGRTDMPNRPLPAVPQSEEEINIYSYPWYFGEMDRKEAMSKVEGLGQEGVFLIRKSTQGGSTEPYTLMFYDGNKVHNLHIRRRSDNKFALGKEKDNEMAFRSVPELVKFHQDNPIALAGGARTILTTCPPRR